MTINEDKIKVIARELDDKEREISDDKYADKRIESGVYWFLGATGLGILGFIGSALGKILTKL